MKFFHLSDLHIGLKLMNRDLRGRTDGYFAAGDRFSQRRNSRMSVVIAGDIYAWHTFRRQRQEVFDSL